MMKNNTIKMIRLFLLILCFVFLSACGIEEPKTVKELKGDLIVEEYFGEQGYPEIVEIELLKRQTNKDEKTDYLYCTVIVENESVRKIGEYAFFSNYYDEGGWILDEIEENECYYLPIGDPQIDNVYWTEESIFITEFEGYGDYDYSVPYGVNCYEVDETICNDKAKERYISGCENNGNDGYSAIYYNEVFEYPNFDVENRYYVQAFFNVGLGRWEVRNIYFKERSYFNYRFDGRYYMELSEMWHGGDKGEYDILITTKNENDGENWNGCETADISFTGYIDFIYGSTLNVNQIGGEDVEIYAVEAISDDIIKAVQNDYSGYFTPGNIYAAFDLNYYEPAVLMVTQCNMVNEKSPEEIYNAYILIKPDRCYLGFKKTTSVSNSYETYLLTKM